VTAVLADLHRHLDGSLRSSTLAELAARAGARVPDDLAFSAGMGLDAALSRFAFILELIQDPREVRRVASEICEDALAEGVTTLEIRFAPQLHRGAPLEAIVGAAVEGAAGRAGVILCGLYGEPPELVEKLVGIGRKTPGVVGIDLAGGPQPAHAISLRDYATAFARAAEAGLGRTVHAGEGRPPREIATAIVELGAQRIGHGTTLLDDPAVRDLVVERGVAIEACLTSNVHTGAIASAEAHPLAAWIAAGVSVCICTDNTLLSSTTLRRELELARGLVGESGLSRLIETGHRAAFPFRRPAK
jgi:adenosine deaminase